jgi:hypothetical protein
MYPPESSALVAAETRSSEVGEKLGENLQLNFVYKYLFNSSREL